MQFPYITSLLTPQKKQIVKRSDPEKNQFNTKTDGDSLLRLLNDFVKKMLSNLTRFVVKPALKVAVVLVLVVLYKYFQLKQFLKETYEKVQIPCMEDYMQDFPLIQRFLGGESLSPQDKLQVFAKMGHPSFFKSRILGLMFLYTTEKEYCNMPSQKPKAPLFEKYRKFLGYHSIIFQNGQKARKERTLLNDGFSQKTYRSMHGPMVESAERLCERMVEATLENGSFQPELLVSRAALEVIGKAGFGMDLSGTENIANVNGLKLLLRIPGNPLCLIPYGAEFLEWYYRDELERVKSLIDKTVRRRLEENHLETSRRESRDLLDVVIRTAQSNEVRETGVDEIEWITDQLKLLYVGGSDTTSTVMCWALIILSNDPGIQKKVKNEIQLVMSGHHLITFDDLSKLSYLEAFIKETLRMYGPFGAPARRLEEGETSIYGIEVNEPQCYTVGFYAMLAQRKEEYFPQPNAFIPERWLDGRYDNEAFGAFSYGFRVCLGKFFAYTEMKTFLAMILNKHTVLPLVQGQTFPHYGLINGIAAPEGPFPVRVIRDDAI